jgi:adenosylhomocysteine nucleosidase
VLRLTTLLATSAVFVACATAPGPRTVAMISANAEWKVVVAQLPSTPVHDTPFGDWLVHRMGGRDVVFFHGGYGKVAAAGSTQYAIDRWHPALIVNLGTCGGLGSERKVGDIVLVDKTIIYDLIEQMGDAAETIADYSTQLDTSPWPARLRPRVVIGPIASADRDVIPADAAGLVSRFHVSVADWESGAIAWVASHNHTPVIILRGVTDLVDATGDATYGDPQAWVRETATVMAALIALLGDALPDLPR